MVIAEMELKINYDTENEGQRRFHASAAGFKAMVGSLGSGKTATGCVEALYLGLEYPGNTILIARRTLPELRMTTMKRFFEFLPDPLIKSWNKVERELVIRTSGADTTIHFGPLDDIGRYKSLELGAFFIDEADQTEEDMWLTLCGRLRLKGTRLVGMLATNPTTRNHWIYKRWVVNPPKNYELFRSKTSDNVKHLPEGYIDQLRSNYPEDWQKRYIDGEWGIIQEGDPVFPDFKQELHVKVLTPVKGMPMIRGWDFGRRRPCCVFGQFDEAGHLRIYRYILGDNEDVYSFRNRVIRISRQYYGEFDQWEDYCDIAGKQERDSGKSSIQVLNEMNIFPKFRFSYIPARVSELRKMMREMIEGQPKFMIDPCNTYLIEGFLGGYSIQEDGEPRKDGYFEHGMDAIGYIVANTCIVEQSMATSELVIPEPKWGFGH